MNKVKGKTWVSATSLRNYFIRDPFLDWAEYHHLEYCIKNKKNGDKINYPRGRGMKRWFDTERHPHTPPHTPTFSQFIMGQGSKFEMHVINFFYQLYGNKIVDAAHSYEATLKAMRIGIPIIYRGFVFSSQTKTFGIPDLIIRSDWLRKIVKTPPLSLEEERVGASAIGARRFHYRPVDVKFSTLDLKANGIHLRNSGSTAAYKGQLCIYVQALGEMQGYDPGVGYILGKRWKYTRKKKLYRGHSCLDRLGTIDFRETSPDFEFKEKVEAAVDWVNRVRLEGSTWDPYKPRLSQPLFSPNLSNRQDAPWRSVKEEVAEITKDVTQMWMCGPKEREIAQNRGIKSWTDPDFTGDVLHFSSNGNKHRIIEQILTVNRGTGSPVLPAKLSSKIFTAPNHLEFFVDFETINEGVVDDFKDFPIAKTNTLIFMIGVGYRRPGLRVLTRNQKKNPPVPEWVFRSFVADSLSLSAQNQICKKFSAYIKSVSSRYGESDAPLYHWGHAEPSIWNKQETPVGHQWTDLLAAFKKEGIAVRGCLNYNLKNISAALYDLGYIQTFWDKSNTCTDGVDAMIQAYIAYQDCQKRGNLDINSSFFIRNIREYNEIDCRVLMDILQAFRTNHV